MKSHLSLLRLVGIAILVCIATMMLTSCSDTSTQATGATVSVKTQFGEPATATADDYATATVKPENPTDAVVAMTSPVISTTAGGSITPAIGTPALAFDFGNTGGNSGSLPLISQNGSMFSPQSAILPAGDNSISLNTGAELDIADSLGRGYTGRGRLRIASLVVLFSVHRGSPPSWTLPSDMQFDTEAYGRMYALTDCSLKLTWGKGLAIPPTDKKVKLTLNLYNNSTKVAGPLSQIATVSDNSAAFVGDNPTKFNRVGIIADLRDSK